MTQSVPTPAQTGRFMFDPLYTQDTVPSVDLILAWVRVRMTTPNTPLQAALSGVHRTHDIGRGIVGNLIDRLPKFDRRRRERLTVYSLDVAREEVESIRNVMLEFGVDLLRHPRLVTRVETLMCYAILAPIEDANRRELEKIRRHTPGFAKFVESSLQETRVSERLVGERATIRTLLEKEAVNNVIESQALMTSRERYLGAVKVAVDEIQNDEYRKDLMEVIAIVERDLQ